MSPEPRLQAWAERSERVLAECLPKAEHEPSQLHAAMRYACLGGGKRMRPLLVYATGNTLGADDSALDHAAAAVELIHAYSLVHDDLPAMDDDALRRGRPTVHIAFDEATAILAGDALQSLAFEVLSAAPLAASSRVELLRCLAVASGAAGMAGGQALDLAVTGGSQSLSALERMHRLKTGALIQASVRMGALCAGADAASLQTLDRFATALGLAFQIRDDLLGMDGAVAALDAQAQAMQLALDSLDRPAPALAALAHMTVQRRS